MNEAAKQLLSQPSLSNASSRLWKMKMGIEIYPPIRAYDSRWYGVSIYARQVVSGPALEERCKTLSPTTNFSASLSNTMPL